MPDLHNDEPEPIPSVSPATSPLSPPNTPETIVDSPSQAQPQTLNVTPSQTRPSTPTMLTSPVKPLLPSMSITSSEPLKPLLQCRSANPWRNAGVPPKEWWSIWEPGKSKVTAANQDSSHNEETDQTTSGNRGDDMEYNNRTIPTALSMQYTDPQSFREAIA